MIVVKLAETHRLTEGCVGEMAVHRGVHIKVEVGKEDMKTKTVHGNVTTSALLPMSPETVERVTEIRNMEAVPNEYFLTIQRDDGRTMAPDRCKGSIAHVHTTALDRAV
jgi:hypothetical protein